MSEAKPLDAIDKRILAIVQVNASLSIGEIAHRVGLVADAMLEASAAA